MELAINLCSKGVSAWKRERERVDLSATMKLWTYITLKISPTTSLKNILNVTIINVTHYQ